MNPIKELGAKLVRDSKLNEEFSAQRGLINQLFPFIYEASKRMSSRAICRWLENNGTKLSISTVSRALRDPQPFWQDIYDDIEPAAQIFAEEHSIDFRALLADHETFFNLIHEHNTYQMAEGRNGDQPQDSYDEYLDACAKLQEDWFSMPPPMIEVCLANVPDENRIIVAETGDPQEAALMEEARLATVG